MTTVPAGRKSPEPLVLAKPADLDLWRRLRRLIEDQGLAGPLSQLAHLLEHEHERWEEIRQGIKTTNLRHQIEEVLQHTEREIPPDLFITVLLYDAASDDLIPFACKGPKFVEWEKDSSGKHKHVYLREIFDGGAPLVSPNLREDPKAVHKAFLIKYDLRAGFYSVLADAAFKYGLMGFFKHEAGFFSVFEMVKMTKVAHVVTGLVARAREEERGK